MGLRGRFHAATLLVVWFAISTGSLAERAVYDDDWDDDDGRSLAATGDDGSGKKMLKQRGGRDSLLELEPMEQKYQHLQQAFHVAARSNASSEVIPVVIVGLAVAAAKAAAIGCVAGGAGSQLMPMLRKWGVTEALDLAFFKMAILGPDVDSFAGDKLSKNKAPGAQLRTFMEEVECRFDFVVREAGGLCPSTSIDDMVSGEPCAYKDNDADPFKGNSPRACSFLHDARQAHAADFATFADNKAEYLATMKEIREEPWEHILEHFTTKMLPLFMVASSTQFAEFILDRAYSPKRRCERNVGAVNPEAVPHSMESVTSLLVGTLARAFPAEPDKNNCGTPEVPEDCPDEASEESFGEPFAAAQKTEASEESSGEPLVAAQETLPSSLLETGSGRAGLWPIINNIVLGAAGVNKLGTAAQFGVKWMVRVSEGVGVGLASASLAPVAAAAGGVTAGLTCAAIAQKITGSKEYMAQIPKYQKEILDTFGATLSAIKTRFNNHWKQPRDACANLERRRNYWAHKAGPKKRLAFRPSRLKVQGKYAEECLAYHAAPAADETRFSATQNLGRTGAKSDPGWWQIKAREVYPDYWGDTCVKLERQGPAEAVRLTIDWSDTWQADLKKELEANPLEDYTVKNKDGQSIDPFQSAPDQSSFPLQILQKGKWADLEDVWVPCDGIMNELSGWTECDIPDVDRSTCWR